MLTEVTRVNVDANFQVGDTDHGPYIAFQACAAQGSKFFVGDLEWQHGNPNIILRLYGPFGLVELTPPQLVGQAPLGLWLYQTPGQSALSAAVLHMPDDAASHIPTLLLLSISTATGAVTASQEMATGVDPLRPSGPNPRYPIYNYPSFVEENGDGSLLLRRLVAVDLRPTTSGSDAEFKATRSSAGVWTFTSPRVVIGPTTVHGVSLNSSGGLNDGTGEVQVLPPVGWGGYGYGYWSPATMWRQAGGNSTLVLSIGVQSLKISTGLYGYWSAYDLCVYGDPILPDGPPDWWEGNYDSTWRPGWGYESEGVLGPVVYPEIRDGIIFIPNPDDPDGDPWAWGTLPPGSGLNDWMQFYADGQYIRIVYGGRVVLVWKMPKDFYDRMVAGGAFGGFYNPYTRAWSPEPPPGTSIPPWKLVPYEGWSYEVDTRRWVGEEGEGVTSHGVRIDADDLLFFPDRVVGGQQLQDDVITSAPAKYLAGRVLPPVVVGSIQAQMAYDAGYAYALYPIGPAE